MRFDRLCFPAGFFAVIFLCLVTALPASANVAISFNYSLDSNNFFAAGSEARASLESAGDFFERVLLDDLDAIVPKGVNTWSTTFNHPSTGVRETVSNPVIPADTLVVYVGSRDLGGTTLGQGGPGGYSASGFTTWLDTIETRGEDPTDGAAAIDFAPWGGALAIDIDSTWHTNHLTAPSSGENDLYSVLLHELCHVLGVGTSDSWNNLISDGLFTGTESAAEHGGDVPLSGTAHWANSTDSGIFPSEFSQEAAMDPDITQGTRKVVTYLDLAGLDDLGWELGPPLPGDATGDWIVDVSDLGALSTNYGTTSGALWGEGDFNDNGSIDVTDLGILSTNYGATATAQAVPEPSALAGLLGLCLAGLVISSRRSY